MSAGTEIEDEIMQSVKVNRFHRRGVGNTGFEPVTFSMSRKRANQLRQLPDLGMRINSRPRADVPPRGSPFLDECPDDLTILDISCHLRKQSMGRIIEAVLKLIVALGCRAFVQFQKARRVVVINIERTLDARLRIIHRTDELPRQIDVFVRLAPRNIIRNRNYDVRCHYQYICSSFSVQIYGFLRRKF
jgi:hypothetical protein